MRTVVFLTGAVFGIVLVATCGTGPGGGNILGDALFGADGAHAAGMAIPLTCEKSYNYDVTYPNGSKTASTTWWEEVQLPGLDPATAPGVVVVLCGVECFGSSCTSACPEGATCKESGNIQPKHDCLQSVGGRMDGGRFYVSCGSRTRITNNGMTVSESGQRWKRGYLRVIN